HSSSARLRPPPTSTLFPYTTLFRSVLAANAVETRIACGDAPTPTPVISRAILAWNREHPAAPCDGIVITPSHNPPSDGGFKYNPDRKSTRLNSSHVSISYAVFCLKK